LKKRKVQLLPEEGFSRYPPQEVSNRPNLEQFSRFEDIRLKSMAAQEKEIAAPRSLK